MRAEPCAAPPALPAWSQLLIDAVKEHGVISSAYHRFWNYSVGNQLLVLFQCMLRKLEPGPINTDLRWKELGRSVVKGENRESPIAGDDEEMLGLIFRGSDDERMQKALRLDERNQALVCFPIGFHPAGIAFGRNETRQRDGELLHDEAPPTLGGCWQTGSNPPDERRPMDSVPLAKEELQKN